MTLSQMLESRFRGDIRYRGAAYLKAERVVLTRITSDEIFGIVRDDMEYQTHLKREDTHLQMHCTCPQNLRAEVACKHLWATILAVDLAGFVSGSVKPGYIPPFVVESDTSEITDEIWDDDSEGDVFTPGGGRTISSRDTIAVQPRLREWDSQLLKLRETIESKDGRTAATAKSARSSTKSMSVKAVKADRSWCRRRRGSTAGAASGASSNRSSCAAEHLRNCPATIARSWRICAAEHPTELRFMPNRPTWGVHSDINCRRPWGSWSCP